MKPYSDDLLPLVYDELRRLAASQLANESPNHTLSATALVHEAYCRLIKSDRNKQWSNKEHFFRAAAIVMRRILVDTARKKNALRHGGNYRRANIETTQLVQPEGGQLDIIDFDEALGAYESENPDKAELVVLRCFAGLSNQDAAKVLEISTRTAERHWNFSLAWLRVRLQG